MNRWSMTACMAAAMLALAACGQARGADAAASADEMKRKQREWVSAYNTGDMNTVVAAFAPDAVVMPPQSPATSGSEEIRKLWTEGSASMREAGLAVVLGDDDTARASGDVGWQSGGYTYRNAAGQAEPGGHYLGVWENRDGKWLIVRFMWTEDRPPASEAPADSEPEAPAG
jgi:ketosteroid isomerase-like protein